MRIRTKILCPEGKLGLSRLVEAVSRHRELSVGSPIKSPHQHQPSGVAFPRRGRSTKSAASSASLRSVLRGVPICARMVRPRAKSSDLARARGYRKVRRDFSRADPVPETTFHQRHAASRRVLQELPDLSVVHKRRDAHEKTSPSGAFLGRTFDGVPQEAGERVAKSLRREECLRSASALPSLRTP